MYVKRALKNLKFWYYSIVAGSVLVAFFFTYFDVIGIDKKQVVENVIDNIKDATFLLENNIKTNLLPFLKQNLPLLERTQYYLPSASTLTGLVEKIASFSGVTNYIQPETVEIIIPDISLAGTTSTSVIADQTFVSENLVTNTVDAVIGLGTNFFTAGAESIRNASSSLLGRVTESYEMVENLLRPWNDFATGYDQAFTYFAQQTIFDTIRTSPFTTIGALFGRIPKLHERTMVLTISANSAYTLMRYLRLRSAQKALLLGRPRKEEKNLSLARLFYRKRIKTFVAGNAKINIGYRGFMYFFSFGPVVVLPSALTYFLFRKTVKSMLNDISGATKLFSAEGPSLPQIINVGDKEDISTKLRLKKLQTDQAKFQQITEIDEDENEDYEDPEEVARFQRQLALKKLEILKRRQQQQKRK